METINKPINKPIWKWNPAQDNFIKTVFAEVQSSKKDTLNIFAHGGIGSGKSVSILFMVDFICMNTPGITALVARRSFESLKSDTFNILKRSPGILDQSKGVWHDNNREFRYTNGSIIYFRHLENADDLLLGPTYGLIYVEQIELCNEDDFRLLKGRLRQFSKNHPYHSQYKQYIDAHQLLPPKNYLFLSANPRGGWVQQKIINDANNGYLMVSMPTSGNKDNLPEDYINTNESDAYKQRFYEGQWKSLQGLIFPEFSDKNLVSPSFDLKMDIPKYQNYVIIDPGYVISKFAVLFACVLPDGRTYIFDEISRNGKDVPDDEKVRIPEMAELIKTRLAKWKITDYMGIIDFAANAKTESGPSKTQQLTECGIHVVNSKKTGELASIMRINGLMKQSKVLINVRCVSTLREIEVYSWKTDKSGNIEKEEPENKNNDFCFSAGTKITLENGTKNIEDIQIGDIVKTQNGYQKVYDAKMTNPNAKVYELILSNGQTLIGTGNHPVYTNKGKVNIDSLKPNDEVIDILSSAFVVGVLEAGYAPVYNISVESDHQYYANNILVANCDCIKYLFNAQPWALNERKTYIAPTEQETMNKYMEDFFKSAPINGKGPKNKRTKLDYGIW